MLSYLILSYGGWKFLTVLKKYPTHLGLLTTEGAAIITLRASDILLSKMKPTQDRRTSRRRAFVLTTSPFLAPTLLMCAPIGTIRGAGGLRAQNLQTSSTNCLLSSYNWWLMSCVKGVSGYSRRCMEVSFKQFIWSHLYFSCTIDYTVITHIYA